MHTLQDALAFASAAMLAAAVFGAEPSPTTADRVEQLKARLEAEPEDQKARRELLVIYIVERDDPEAARRYSDAVDDEAWKDCVLLASRDVKELREEDLLKVGKWYRGLGGKARGGAKVAMLRRSRAYFRRYLEVHAGDDTEGKSAVAALRQVEALLQSAERSPRAKAVPKRPAAGKVNAGDKNAVDADTKDAIDLRKGLVLHWTFDAPTVEGTKVEDLSGLNHHGSLVDGELAASERGRALRGEVKLDDEESLRHEGSYTIAVLVNTASPSEAVQWVNKSATGGRGGRQFSLGFRTSDDRLTSYTGGSGGTGEQLAADADALPFDRWVHLIVTHHFDGENTQVRFYRDGQPAGTGAARGKTPNSPAPLTVAITQGSLDDLRLYQRAITEREAAALALLDAAPAPGAPALAAEDEPALEEEPEEMDDDAGGSSSFFGIPIE